ncbi:hypothetical protein IMSHALPRED_008574 [Imshaugia aleurites]|uniref:AB hydrolase-1 domain-containing protein n=1 Tax=Imshaugia aleurites TaxID=172621 RepID=A0A8H3FYA6_9LECA|nr:hypothetical protein IMSHALPRED_008574 [Imshaugia aleurites]
MAEPLSEWTTSEKKGLISVGTHKLYVSTSGPARLPGNPLLIIFPGANAACKSWESVSTLLQDTVRVLLYDRSGLGRSEHGPHRDTGSTAADELSTLLKAVDLPGPYILVAHSYGGCVAREFLHLHAKDVVGMVLSETGTETRFRYADEQYRRQVLGDCPLSVIRGDSAFTPRRREDVSVSHEQGRARDGMLEAMSIADEQLKREQLKLSRNSRFRNVPNCGHNVHLTHPDVVAEEVKWVLSNLMTRRTKTGWVDFADSTIFVRVRQALGLS